MADEIIIVSDSRPYKSLITDIGNAKMTRAVLEGRKVNIVEMRLGDGGGSYYMPTTDAKSLVNEVWRGGIASKTINEQSPNIIAVKTVIPSSVGGFTVREASLHDDEGDMIAVCNMPDIGKATLPEGISSSLDIVMNILLSNVDALDFVVNPTLDPASRDDVEKAIAAHNADPDAHSQELQALREQVERANQELIEAIMSGGVPYGKELTESWAELQARIKKGDFSGIHIGDFKTIQLTTGETVVMEVAGIDQYCRCGDQEIGHHVDFISRDCLKGARQFNSTATNNGTEAEPNPWRASELFQAMNDESTGVFSTLPADLKPCIIDKRALLERRYSSSGDLNDSTGWDWNFMGKLWLPTEREVWGSAVWGDQSWTGGGGCNIQYPIFRGGAKHIVKGDGNGGSRVIWWEATAKRDSAAYVCAANHSGAAGDNVVTYTGPRAPLCFRIG